MQCKQEESGVKPLKSWEEKTTNLEFCALKNYPSEMMRECVACRPALEEKLKVLWKEENWHRSETQLYIKKEIASKKE